MKTQLRISFLTLLFAVIGQAFTAFAQIPRFLTPVSYPVPGITMQAVADVNGDGILDIITANGLAPGGNGGVSILFGLGHGTFKPAKQIVSGGSPGFLLVGDFNNDGKADIAVANEPDPTSGIVPVGGPALNSVSILFGNGDGTFQPSIDTPTSGARQIAAADFNGDGKLDLLVATGDSGTVQVLLNNGNGSFIVRDTTAPAFTGVIVGDFNRDGKQDFIAAGLVMLGNGDGTFTTGPASDSFPAIAADFNGDGILDLASLFVSDGRFITGEMNLGLPDGSFAASFIDDFNGYSVVAADFDGDGKMDIFGTGGPVGNGIDPPIGGLGLGKGDGTFAFGAPGFGAAIGTDIGTAFAAVGDLDHNGSPDLVIANRDVVLVALNTAGHPPLAAQLTTNAIFVVGGATTVTGTVFLGGPAPTGGASLTLVSSSPAATFPGGKTVKIPAGSITATFAIATKAVTTPTPVTISATYQFTSLATQINVLPSFTIASVAATPASLIGMLGGDAAVGTVTLSGPASNGTVVKLASANSAILTVPASVAFTPGATTATFPIIAQHVAANTSVAVSGTLGSNTRTGSVSILKETATIIVTKAEYVVKKGLVNVEATSTDRVASLQIFNPTTGLLVGTIPLVNVGKFVGQFSMTGSFPSLAAQSSVGGLAIAAVAQK
jgi:FG-GAP-like repeat